MSYIGATYKPANLRTLVCNRTAYYGAPVHIKMRKRVSYKPACIAVCCTRLLNLGLYNRNIFEFGIFYVTERRRKPLSRGNIYARKFMVQTVVTARKTVGNVIPNRSHSRKIDISGLFEV